MYICICKGVTQRQLLAAIDNGAKSVRDLRQQCDVCNCCGKCAPDVKRVLAERTSEAPAQPVAPGMGKPVPA